MAHHGVRLVNAAVEDALSEGDAWRVFQAVDTWRARSFDFPPVLPPEDADLAHALTELRSIESDLRETMTAGLLEQRRRAEERVQRITRRVEAGTDGESVTRLDRGELGNALDDRAVVSYFTHRGMIHAVWFDGPHHEVAELGVEARVADEVHSLRFALYRLLATQASPASLDAAERSLKTSAETLSSLLVEPLRMSDSPLVIIPTGVLHRLPWGVLPGIDGRPVSVSPSFRAWMRASRLDRTPGRAALVAGPDLEGARNEVERLARLYPSAQRLTGRNAKVDRVLGLLDGAFVAHLAAHGTFRADNPLFSSLRMADGPLTVYDLERLRSVPSVVVMPSCESGLSDVGVVDDLLGLAAALLRLGTSSLIAPVVPIPDTATLPLMMSVHRRMRQGSPPAAALSEAVTADDGDSPPERAVRAAFVSLGA